MVHITVAPLTEVLSTVALTMAALSTVVPNTVAPSMAVLRMAAPSMVALDIAAGQHHRGQIATSMATIMIKARRQGLVTISA